MVVEAAAAVAAAAAGPVAVVDSAVAVAVADLGVEATEVTTVVDTEGRAVEGAVVATTLGEKGGPGSWVCLQCCLFVVS